MKVLILYYLLASGTYLFATLASTPLLLGYCVLAILVVWSQLAVWNSNEGYIPRNKDTVKTSKLHPKDLEVIRFLA